jgi:hypothetical protein
VKEMNGKELIEKDLSERESELGIMTVYTPIDDVIAIQDTHNPITELANKCLGLKIGGGN